MRTVLWVICAAALSLSPASAAVLVPVQPPAASQSDPAELVKQARKLNSEGKQGDAIGLYRQAIERSPDLFDAHLGLGVALDLQGDYAEARQHLAKAIELAPDGARNQALTAMGVSYAFESNAAEASKFYRQIFDRQMASHDPGGAAETANALARVHLESGQLDEAFKWYETGYETGRNQPKLEPALVDLSNLRWAHAQARIAARRGDRTEAHRQMAIVRSLVDKNSNPDQAIQYPYLAGYVALFLKDYPTAIDELQKASQADPFILLLLAQSYEGAGDAAKARECYQKVMASNAHNPNNAFARPIARKKLADAS